MSQDTANILVFPPSVSVAAPAFAGLMEWLLPYGILPAPGGSMLVAGVLLMLLAGGLAVSGTRAFKRAKTNIDPRQPALVLVNDGPYRFTRNPMYLGMITLNLGLTLAASLDWGLLTTPLLALTLHFGVVLREEAYLKTKFGEPYAMLLKRTRRWL
ncbi:methyltransferase family protein [Actibacterium pelagium]|uniref:Protein-S-isoprenylcysteine O-methyltransferase Ste14 n=1 Tax=Actibacterium pelagium TaxID=2029103 RepID=A0A917EIU6_9RHOB|nr:isoprenylcysteine carboxylmethyltransferase family protein [Actibacterium pelagium]GGE46376.1 hypothetical protein GCM10011517_12570 [Actibacterium pelagium]